MNTTFGFTESLLRWSHQERDPLAPGIVVLFFFFVLDSQEITISAHENILSVPSIQHLWESMCSFQ